VDYANFSCERQKLGNAKRIYCRAVSTLEDVFYYKRIFLSFFFQNANTDSVWNAFLGFEKMTRPELTLDQLKKEVKELEVFVQIEI